MVTALNANGFYLSKSALLVHSLFLEFNHFKMFVQYYAYGK